MQASYWIMYREIIAACSVVKDKNHRRISARRTHNLYYNVVVYIKQSLGLKQFKQAIRTVITGLQTAAIRELWSEIDLKSFHFDNDEWNVQGRFSALKMNTTVVIYNAYCLWMSMKTASHRPSLANRHNILPQSMLIIYSNIIWIVYLYYTVS